VQGDGQVVITITDNGRGFDPQLVEPGRGLPGMRQRATELGAELTIGWAEGGGSSWRLAVPIPKDDAQ
jgi:signal transduction histidine kinase